ncbi:prepilin-type N-terminal cleavage/methylation domain-containing protein [Vibrio navarrensis]|uniref:pilin n=1 Tax=Vibrio navarrensis TaxID=29495 RepID=UPI001867A54D|nr:pilin [Vibrio navarrensis]MBE3660092.1 prepilin-type N-terminal cleavage/methylation domain-containing protein [Vibrio navarrensis]
MKKHNRVTKQQGFTLIELMIVVAIIGVLSAVAIPAYKSYVAKSEAATAAATVRGLLTNIDMYQQEVGSFPTDITKVGGTQTMNAFGSIGLASTASGGTATFTFTDGSLKTGGAGNNAATIIYTKDNLTGWSCTHTIQDTSVVPSGC